ncbi:unnamed protein product, partial [Meganyctiphanes norvegica]
PLIIQNKDGYTPVDLAQTYGHVEFYNWAIKKDDYAGYNLSKKPAKVVSRTAYEEKVKELMDWIIRKPGLAELNIRNGYLDMHYQDMQRQTALHHAASAGSLDTVHALLGLGCYPAPVTLDGCTPADLAQERGHCHVHDLLIQRVQHPTPMDWIRNSQNYYDLLTNISTAGRKEDTSDATAQYEMCEAVKKISSLLSQGTPITPPGSMSTELTAMSINNHSPRILELLLSSGAPMYGTDGRYSILQMIWLTTTS